MQKDTTDINQNLSLTQNEKIMFGNIQGLKWSSRLLCIIGLKLGGFEKGSCERILTPKSHEI